MPSTNYQIAGSGAGWTNSGNITADDGAVATDSVYRADFPEPDILQSANLVAGSFGIGGLGAGDSISGIEVQVEASKTGDCQTELFAYLTVSGSPVGSAKSLGLLGASLADFVGGSSSDSWGATLSGADMANIGVVVYCFPNSAGAITTVSVDKVRLNAHYTTPGPDAFTFGTRASQPFSTVVTSDIATISGLTGSATVSIASLFDNSVASPEYRKNGGAWKTTSDTVVNGDTLQMRHTTSSAGSTTLTSALQINGQQGTFQTTTVAVDTVPDAFDFADESNANPSSVYLSQRVSITGINSPAAVTVTGGSWYKNGIFQGASAGSVNNLDDVQVQVTAPSGFLATNNGVLTVGGVSGTYSVTTRAAEVIPDAFAFTDLGNQAAASVITSNTVTITGIEAAANVTFAATGTATAREYRKNGGAWTAIGATTVNNGDTLQLRLTTDAGAGVTGGIQVTIEGVSDTWAATTLADITPNAFSFSTKANIIPGDPGPHFSDEVQISGIGTTVTASALYSEIADNATQPVSAGYVDPNPNVQNNDYIEVRTKATAPIPRCGQQSLTIPVSVGDTTVNWTLTTKPGMPAGNCIC